MCPAFHRGVRAEGCAGAGRGPLSGTTCEPCPLRSRCPVMDRRAGAYVLKADLVKVNIERRRRAEATEEWRKRYDIRAGIEGTNSELKRAHGLGRLRVRGGRRVPCRLPEGIGVQLQADGPCTPGGDGPRLSGRSGRYLRSRPHEGAAPQLPPGALSHGRGTATGSRLS